ncbi:MAG: hypothetical protein C0169_04585 [Thermodesulfobacterium geofontis]|uniref:Uncharacterized protein n=1 Tax=Thermodesulfobacterium geofontis TaxID=1295609 RepID=A0A2N7QCU7_9BACT|nr:MAG: hypothetical protein C0169_04585 [Thermodesulfobacterium geofontis]
MRRGIKMKKSMEFKIRDVATKEIYFLLEVKKGSVMEALRRVFPCYYDDIQKFPKDVREEILRKFLTTDMSVQELLDLINDTYNELYLF